MKYRAYRDESNRATVAIEGCPLILYPYYSWRIKKKFSLKKHGKLLKSLDGRSQNYKVCGHLVSIEWDNWSGFSVVAVESGAEEIVSKIGRYLESKCK
ncbi:MAG: hypothetical protein WD397_03160 [Wenzhouxiangellaceae bacterium]